MSKNDDLVTGAEIGRRLGVSRQRAYALIEQPAFPRPHQTIGRSPIWVWADVVTWIRANRLREGLPRGTGHDEELDAIRARGYTVRASRDDGAVSVMRVGGDFANPGSGKPYVVISKRGWGSVSNEQGETLGQATEDALRRFRRRLDQEAAEKEDLAGGERTLLDAGCDLSGASGTGLAASSLGWQHLSEIRLPGGDLVQGFGLSPNEARSDAIGRALVATVRAASTR